MWRFQTFLIFSLLHVLFCQDESAMIEKYIKIIKKSLTEILVFESDTQQFVRTYDNFKRLLDKYKFVAEYLNVVVMNRDEFSYFLLMRRKKIVNVEVLSTSNDTTTWPEVINPVITLKLTSPMNYTLVYRFDMKMELGANRTFKIVKMHIYQERFDSKDHFQSTWTPQYLDTPDRSAKEFAESICADIIFSKMPNLDQEKLFTSNFFAFVDTNFLYFYDLDMFIKFMKQFNGRYQLRNENHKCHILTEDNDHVVFHTRVRFDYDDDIEIWWFEVEAVYIDQQWKISKIFIGHPHFSNEVFENRAGKELLVELKSQVSQSMGETEVIRFNETLLVNAEIRICREFGGHYDDGFKFKIKKWFGDAHIYSKFEYEQTFELFIVLYYPDDFGNYTEMKFKANYNSLYNTLNIIQVTIQCPDIKAPPDFEEIEYKYITMDTERIIIEPRRTAFTPENFEIHSSRTKQETNKQVYLYDSPENDYQIMEVE